jgi:hypothetical protein
MEYQHLHEVKGFDDFIRIGSFVFTQTLTEYILKELLPLSLRLKDTKGLVF